MKTETGIKITLEQNDYSIIQASVGFLGAIKELLAKTPDATRLFCYDEDYDYYVYDLATLHDLLTLLVAMYKADHIVISNNNEKEGEDDE